MDELNYTAEKWQEVMTWSVSCSVVAHCRFAEQFS